MVMSVSRIVVNLFGIFFTALGLGFWLAPELAAQTFNLEAIGLTGLVALRAELGGLFIGLAALCFAGAATKSRALLFGATGVLGAIAAGRVIGLLAGADASEQLGPLAVEVAAITALLVYARSLSASHRPTPRRRMAIAGAAVALVLAVGTVALLDARVELKIFEKGAAGNMAR